MKETNRKIKKFDEYEEDEQTEFSHCVHCGYRDCSLRPIDDLTWGDGIGWLCKRCLKEEEEARKAIADEKKLHN